MTTQLLFGETYTLLEQTEGWYKIENRFDKYQCWISATQHAKLGAGTFQKLAQQPVAYCNEQIGFIKQSITGLSFPITLGALLPNYNNGLCTIDNQQFEYSGAVAYSLEKNSLAIAQTARRFLNAPYLWGGKQLMGADCSGFVQTVFRLHGLTLPRDAAHQVALGTPLSFVEEAEAGDLAFFDNEEGQIVHVGLLLSNQEIIHASGSVKIEKFDHYGIFSNDQKRYSHLLRVIKRIL